MEVDTVRAPRRDLEALFSHASNKTHCPKGHRYSRENTRYTSQRKGKDVNRKCRACERNAKRVSYGLEPEPLPTKLSALLDNT
jgi:hypothetical protein